MFDELPEGTSPFTKAIIYRQRLANARESGDTDAVYWLEILLEESCSDCVDEEVNYQY